MKATPKPKSVRQLRAKFLFPDDYNPVYANGAWGGVTPHGEIVAHFFQERQGLPLEQQLDVDSNGILLNTSIKEPEGHGDILVRFVHAGVTMDLATAKAVHNWLGEKIGDLEQRIKKGKV